MTRAVGAVRAWTLGYPPSYEKSVRIPGNGKAPGGYLFPTREAALTYRDKHPEEAGRYGAYEVELPGTYAECSTREQKTADIARHAWHQDDRNEIDPAVDFMPECGICIPKVRKVLTHDLVTVVAPFINPDTGRPA